MLVIMSYLIVIGSVFGGFVMNGGHLAVLFQPIESLIIAGAAIGSFLVSNKWKIVKSTCRDIGSAISNFGYSRAYYVELLSMMYEFVAKVKKNGVMSIETDIDDPAQSPIISKYKLFIKDKSTIKFFVDYLRVIVRGRIDIYQLKNLMVQDIETYTHEKEQSIHALNKLADSMPIFGILAAVMGFLHAMGSLGIPFEQLGVHITKALVGTFLGVLLGYGFFASLTVLLKHKLNFSLKALRSIRVILIAMVNNFSPTIAVEFGRKIIYGHDRPKVHELESIIKTVKQAKSGDSK